VYTQDINSILNPEQGEEEQETKKATKEVKDKTKKKKGKKGKGDTFETTGPGRSIHMFRKCVDD